MTMFGNWFKTKEEYKREQRDYEKKMFPYGSNQREKINNIINEIKGKEDLSMAIYYYLMADIYIAA